MGKRKPGMKGADQCRSEKDSQEERYVSSGLKAEDGQLGKGGGGY